MEKQFYPTIGDDFRAYSKQRDCGGLNLVFKKELNLLVLLFG